MQKCWQKCKNLGKDGKNASQLAKMTGSQFQMPALWLSTIFANSQVMAKMVKMQKCWQKCFQTGKDDWISVSEASYAIEHHFCQFPGDGKDGKNA